MNRRDILKSMASLPFLGLLGFAAKKEYTIHAAKRLEKQSFTNFLNINATLPPELAPATGDYLKIGIIGVGIRGPHLLQAMGFLHPEKIKAWEKSSPDRLNSFLGQEDLKVRVTAICDLFDNKAKLALESVESADNKPIRYKKYQDLIANSGVDAVFIATADLWHAPIAIAALKAGKHVYIEKPMTHKIKELYELRKAVLESGKTLQLGHQHRQTQSFLTARDVIEKNVLGHVNLISTHTNRNSDNGAWQYNLWEEFPDDSIDWKQFAKGVYDTPLSREKFFRWRKYWKLGSGLTGDLLSHEFDSINSIMKMGIPKYVTASGGTYTHRDGRDVPDVMTVSMEYPDYFIGSSQEKGKVKGMTFVYSASLGNQFSRKTTFMGHDGTMQLGSTLEIFADPSSSKYKEQLKSELIQNGRPIFTFDPASNQVDAVTSATTQYFAEKGLLFDYRNGKKVDVTHLHVKEWLHCIRTGETPSCSIDVAFEEAIASLMSTLAYKTGRRVEWNKDEEKIIVPGMENVDLDKILVS